MCVFHDRVGVVAEGENQRGSSERMVFMRDAMSGQLADIISRTFTVMVVDAAPATLNGHRLEA